MLLILTGGSDQRVFSLSLSRSLSLNVNEPYGLFTLPDSDSKPYGYIVLFRTFHIGSDPDPDPYSDGFPNGYCIHVRDRSLSYYIHFNQRIRV